MSYVGEVCNTAVGKVEPIGMTWSHDKVAHVLTKECSVDTRVGTECPSGATRMPDTCDPHLEAINDVDTTGIPTDVPLADVHEAAKLPTSVEDPVPH